MDIQLWKSLAAGLSGCILSLSGFWMVEGRNLITRSEAVDIVEVHSPYRQDHKLIMDKLDRDEKVGERLTGAINGLTVEIGKLRAYNEARDEFAKISRDVR